MRKQREAEVQSPLSCTYLSVGLSERPRVLRCVVSSRWRSDMAKQAKNTICLWYDGGAEGAARFYAETFPDSSVGAVHRAPADFPSGKKGDVLTVEFTVLGIPRRPSQLQDAPYQGGSDSGEGLTPSVSKMAFY